MLNLYSILRLMIALLFIQSTAFGQTTQPYAPNAELAIKGGSHRSFGRLGLLIPLHQSPNHLLFTNIFGLYDTNNAAEINIGLGIRKMFQQHILGLTFFYDQRKSQHHINFPQITISTEYLTKNLEMRANLYIPLKGKTNIAKAKRIQRTPFGTLTQSQQLFEVPLKGFDVEMGGHINNIPWLSAHASYYHFHHRDIGHVPGFRARSALSINQHLNIEAEYSYDRLRKHNYFIGARLKFQMGKPQANSLAKKMTSMVVRDIDVVTTTNTFSQAQWSPSEAIPPEQTNNEQEQGPQTTQQQHITHADLRWAYQLLGLAPDATITDARRAYHRMAARVHPDRNPSPNANEQFIDLREAYQLIEQHLTTSQRAQAPVAQSTPAITPTMASSNAVTLYQPTATSPTTSVQTHHQAEQLTLEWTGPHQVQAHLASGHVIHIPREYIHWHFPPPADLPFEHFRQAITQQQVILAFDQEQEQIENISILPRGLGGMPKRARGECSGKTGDTQPTQGASERTDVVTAQGNGRRRVDSPQGRSSSSVTNRKRPREQSASPSNLSERTDVANTGNDKRRRVGNPNTPWDTGFRALLEQTNQFIQTPSSQSFQRMLLGPDVANAITQPNQVLLSTLAEMLPKLVISPHGFHSHVFKQVLCLLTLEGRTDHPRLNANPWEVAYRLTKTFGRQAIFYLQETYQGHAGPTHPLAGYSFALPTNDNWSLIWQTWNHTFRSWDEYWQQQLFARATEIEKALPQHHASIHQLIHLTSERQKQTAAITALTNEMDAVRNKTKTTDPETKKFLIELLQLKQAALDTLEEKQASYQQALSQAEAKIDHPTLRQALSGFFKTMPHSGASTTPTSNTADAQMPRSLENALMAGHLGKVRGLLERGANIKAKGRNQSSALHLAACSGNVELIRFLLNRKDSNGTPLFDVNDQGNKFKVSPLSLAAANSHFPAVQLLLEEGANINARDYRQLNVLHSAIYSGNVELIRFLLNQKDSNENPLLDINDQENLSKYTPLLCAAVNGLFPAVQLLLEKGANINARNRDQDNALHLAARSGNVNLIRFLLNQKDSNGIPLFDVNNQGNQFKVSPLLFAVQAGHLDAIKALLNAGANIHLKDSDNRDILDCANYSKSREVIAFVKQAVLQNTPSRSPNSGALVATTSNTADTQMDRTLEDALVAGNLDEVRSLLEKGASIKAKDCYQYNALHLAASSGNVELIQFLLNREDSNGTPLFDVNDQRNLSKGSALMRAVRAGRLPAVQLLLEKGANIKARDLRQFTALHLAASSGNVELIRFLLNLKDSNESPLFDINDQDNEFKRSPLLLATERGHLPVIKALLDAGANIRLKDSRNRGIFEYADYSESREAIAFVKQAVLQGNVNTPSRSPNSGALVATTSNTADTQMARTLEDALVAGDLGKVRSLLEKGANIKAKNRYQHNSLHLAASSGNVDLIRFLLNQKDSNENPLFDVNDQDNEFKFSPLLLAAAGGHLPAVQLLVERRAKTNATDHSGNNALHLAARYSHMEIALYLLELNHSEFPIINLLLQKNTRGLTAFNAFFKMRFPALESPMNFLNRVRSSVSWPHIKHIITKYTHIDPRRCLTRYYSAPQNKGHTIIYCILRSISKEIRDLTPHLVRYTDTKFFFLQKFSGKYSPPTKAQVIEQINAMNDAQKDQLVQHYVNISSEINQAAELMGQWGDKKTLARNYLDEERIELSRLSRFYSIFAPWLVPMLNKEQYQQLRLAVNQWKLLGLDLAKKYKGWSSAIWLARQGLKMKFETLPELFETAISLIQARTMNDSTIEYANGLLVLCGAKSVSRGRLIETKQLVGNITDESLTLCIHHLESDPSLSTNPQTGQARSMSLLDLLKEEHTKRKEEEANGMHSQDISESSEPPSEDDSTDSESTSEMPYNREFALTSSDDELSPTQGASPNPSKPKAHDNSGDEYIPSNASSTEEEPSWWAPNDSSEDPSSDGDITVTDMSEHESLSPGDDSEWEASDIRTAQDSDITE